MRDRTWKRRSLTGVLLRSVRDPGDWAALTWRWTLSTLNLSSPARGQHLGSLGRMETSGNHWTRHPSRRRGSVSRPTFGTILAWRHSASLQCGKEASNPGHAGTSSPEADLETMRWTRSPSTRCTPAEETLAETLQQIRKPQDLSIPCFKVKDSKIKTIQIRDLIIGKKWLLSCEMHNCLICLRGIIKRCYKVVVRIKNHTKSIGSLGNPSKKKCWKFHIWGEKWCLKCILSHFKLF